MSRQLDHSITDSETLIKVSPIFTRGDFPENGIIQIESELVRYENTSSDEFINCTRGYLGTSAASHDAGVTVTLYTGIATDVEDNSVTELLSPSSIVATILTADILNVSTVAMDALVLTLPTPASSEVRFITVCHKTGSLGTLSINGSDLAAGEAKEFLWDGSGWASAPSSGGGGVSNPLAADLDGGGFDITDVGQFSVSDGSAATPAYGFDNAATGLFLTGGNKLGISVVASEIGRFDTTGLMLVDNKKLFLKTDESASLYYDNTNTAFIMDDGSGAPIIGMPASVNRFTLTSDVSFSAGSLASIDLRGDLNRISLETNDGAGLQIDESVTAGNTRLLIYDVDNATLERVTVGAADSGGSGFKVLRIPN